MVPGIEHYNVSQCSDSSELIVDRLVMSQGVLPDK